MLTQERFEKKYIVEPNGCWIWRGAHQSLGYGTFMFHGRPQGAHRVAYELYREPIAPGLELHHTCGNKGCVNPDHLIPQTHQVHAQLHQVNTHCKRGHEMSGENLLVEPKSGNRSCRACNRIRQQRARNKARVKI